MKYVYWRNIVVFQTSMRCVLSMLSGFHRSSYCLKVDTKAIDWLSVMKGALHIGSMKCTIVEAVHICTKMYYFLIRICKADIVEMTYQCNHISGVTVVTPSDRP